MSLQVGNSCYATPVDAGVVACAAFSPVSQLSNDGSKFRTVSCSGADQSSGALNLVVTTTDTVSGISTAQQITQQNAFPDCVEGIKVDAYLSIFGALLTAVCVCYGLYRVYSFITSNSRVTE